MVYLYWLDCPEKLGPVLLEEVSGSNRTEKTNLEVTVCIRGNVIEKRNFKVKKVREGGLMLLSTRLT